MIELEFVPDRAALLGDQDNTLDVLLHIKPPGVPDAPRDRLPLNLAIVIDRSGSMSGLPLAEAKRCAATIVDGLSAKDWASVVVYDHAADVLVASRAADDKDVFHAALRAIESRGNNWLANGRRTGGSPPKWAHLVTRAPSIGRLCECRSLRHIGHRQALCRNGRRRSRYVHLRSWRALQ